MLNQDAKLNPKLFKGDIEFIPNRKGFGEALVALGKSNLDVVALCADLTESTQMAAFAEAYPERFVEIGVAEQNLATVASGMAATGKIPFITSYAAFSPGRNWEQIRTTIALNNQPVKVVGSHGGVSVGPDGATHQALEDIALMRAMPNMTVVVPADHHEARRATIALAASGTPAYLRLAREKTPVVTTEHSSFEIGRADVYSGGQDVTIIACGPLLYEALLAARDLARKGITAEVINCPTIKPLDAETILASVRKTKAAVTVEEAQINGGLGGAVAELLAERHPTHLERIGVRDRFGQSGKITELWDEYELSAPHIYSAALKALDRKLQ